MKKYIVLGVSTVAFVAVFMLFGAFVVGSVPYVSVQKLQPTNVQDVVISTGTISYAVNEKVYSPYTGLVTDVFVTSGDVVKKGELIAKVTSVKKDMQSQSVDVLNKVLGENKKEEQGDLSSKLISDIFGSTQSTLVGGAVGEQLAEVYGTSEVYKQLLLGNYSILDEYDKYLEAENNEYKEVLAKENINQKANLNLIKEIYANANGVVSNFKCEKNSIVDVGKELLTIVSKDRMEVDLQIGEDKISQIKRGQKVEVSGVAFGKNKYMGTVSNISDIATLKTTATGKDTTVSVTVTLDDIDSKLKYGYSAKCSIITNSKENVCLIPYESINVSDSGQEFVYLYKNGIVNIVDVNTKNEYAKGVEISNKIDKENYIVTNAKELLDGEFVKINNERTVN